jgi:hypothetical protein
MNRIVLAFLLATAWVEAHAQSPLPPCPGSPADTVRKVADWSGCVGLLTIGGDTYDGEWHNGFGAGQGVTTFAEGVLKYVGGHFLNSSFGRGSLLSSKGYTIVEGDWNGDFTVTVDELKWRKVGSTTATTWFVLSNSIKQEGAFRRAWIMRGYHEPHPNTGWLSVRQLTQFDCKNERYLVIKARGFSGSWGSGNQLDEVDGTKWDYVEPVGPLQATMKYVCEFEI